ncbi:MAG: ATP-binding cassette domain-containing protein [Lachnospiraceae bacterium]|nr:ATP-binding cassette domain-containing protein [Lachnospiraceae bacterium]
MTIYLEHIYKSYNNSEALKDFNLSVEDGKCYALVGPKDSGKTTALKIFMGTEKPDSGKVSRMGDYKYPKLMTAYVPQEESLNLKKNAVWNVKKAHRTATKGGAAEELSRFFSDEEMNKPAGDLSIGKRRIIEIIKALFVPADFVVLDDPFREMEDSDKNHALDYVTDKLGTRPLLIAQREEPASGMFRIIRM